MTVPTRVSPWRQREKTYEGVSSDKRYKAKTMCRGPFFDARAVLFRCTMGAKKKKITDGHDHNGQRLCPDQEPPARVAVYSPPVALERGELLVPFWSRIRRQRGNESGKLNRAAGTVTPREPGPARCTKKKGFTSRLPRGES